MAKDTKAIAWARQEAHNLETERQQSGTLPTNGRLGAAATFFSVNCSKTAYATIADTWVNSTVDTSMFRSVIEALRSWADYATFEMVVEQPFKLRSRVEASTDLMDQVKLLLDEATLTPAAAVMLAGAALEELLRGMVESNGLRVSGKPGINAYASALRSNDYITRQEKKDIDAWAGNRNEAAHGHFGTIDHDKAVRMAGGIGMFLGKYSGKAEQS